MVPRQTTSEWCYDQQRSHGGVRHFSGRVEHIRGASAETLLARLARASADLLQWAADVSSAESAKDA
jgi:hypothetical protein